MAEWDQLLRTLRNCLKLWLVGTHHGRGYKKVSKPASNTQQVVRYIPSMLFGHESLLLSLSLFKPRSSRRIPLICLLVSCRSCEDVANIRQLHNLWVHGDKWVHSNNSLEHTRILTLHLKAFMLPTSTAPQKARVQQSGGLSSSNSLISFRRPL